MPCASQTILFQVLTGGTGRSCQDCEDFTVPIVNRGTPCPGGCESSPRWLLSTSGPEHLSKTAARFPDFSSSHPWPPTAAPSSAYARHDWTAYAGCHEQSQRSSRDPQGKHESFLPEPAHRADSHGPSSGSTSSQFGTQTSLSGSAQSSRRPCTRCRLVRDALATTATPIKLCAYCSAQPGLSRHHRGPGTD